MSVGCSIGGLVGRSEGFVKKLDGVGPVDNRPYTDYLGFSKWETPLKIENFTASYNILMGVQGSAMVW